MKGICRVEVGEVAVFSQDPAFFKAAYATIFLDGFQTSFKWIRSDDTGHQYFGIDVLFVFRNFWLEVGDSAALQDVSSVVNPVAFAAHLHRRGHGNGQVLVFRLVFLDFGCAVLLKAHDVAGNQRCRVTDSCNLGTEVDRFCLEEERVREKFAIQLPSEAHFDVSRSLNVAGIQVG